MFYGGKVIEEIKTDIEEIMAQSRLVDDRWFKDTPWISSILASILRLLAPLL